MELLKERILREGRVFLYKKENLSHVRFKGISI